MSLAVSSKSPAREWRLVWILVPIQVAYVFYVMLYLQSHGELPAPFMFNAFDSFMDFFNTNYWAFQEGRYDEWKSIYPIFVFALSKLFTSPSCAASTPPVALRACDIGAIGFLLASYLAGAACCAHLLMSRLKQRGARRREVVGWFLVVALSVPGLWAMERGNYIVIAFLFLALARCFEGNWKSALFLALAINIKQYLAVLWIVPLLKRRYDLALMGVVFAIIPNVLGLILVPDFHYGEILGNMFSFSTTTEFSPFETAWMPTSFASWLRVVGSPYADLILVGDVRVWVHALLSAGLWAERGLFITALYLAATRARVEASYISFICMTGLVASLDGLGGYALLLLFPYLDSLATRPYGRLVAALFILVCLPLGLAVGPALARPAGQGLSFLTDEIIAAPPELPLGSYLRPILVLGLLVAIVFDLLAANREAETRQRTSAASSL